MLVLTRPKATGLSFGTIDYETLFRALEEAFERFDWKPFVNHDCCHTGLPTGCTDSTVSHSSQVDLSFPQYLFSRLFSLPPPHPFFSFSFSRVFPFYLPWVHVSRG